VRGGAVADDVGVTLHAILDDWFGKSSAPDDNGS